MLNHIHDSTPSALDRVHSLSSFMSHPASFITVRDPLPDHEQKRAALGYLNEAWAEARHDGVDGDCLAQASLFAAFAELVGTYGETPWRNSWKAFPSASAMASSRSRSRSSRLATNKTVIARLDRANQYSSAFSFELRRRGVLDHPVKPGDGV